MTENTLTAGAARIDITPPIGFRMQGIMRRVEPSVGIHMPLAATALVLADDNHKIAVIDCDLIGLDLPLAAEIRQAFHRVKSRRQQIDAVQPQITTAVKALELNFVGIRGGEIRPIEAQQAISALTDARLNNLNATLAYNVAQLELLRALGQPPGI